MGGRHQEVQHQGVELASVVPGRANRRVRDQPASGRFFNSGGAFRSDIWSACINTEAGLNNQQSHGVRGGSSAALRGGYANPSNLIRVMPAEGVRDATRLRAAKFGRRQHLADRCRRLIERLRDAQAARALHHQCCGAEFHRQCVACRRRIAIDDHRAARSRCLRRARRCAACQSRNLRRRTQSGVRSGDRRDQGRRQALCARSGADRSLAATRGLCARIAVASSRGDPDERCGVRRLVRRRLAAGICEGAANHRCYHRRDRSCDRWRANASRSQMVIR